MHGNVLIIEDDPRLFPSIEESLGEEPRLFRANTLADAMRMMASEPIDVIVFDHDLKDDGGLEGYKKLKRFDPRKKVIMISAVPDVETAVAATKLGVRDFLRKPIEGKKLRDSVEQLLAAESKPLLDLLKIERSEWLSGTSEKIRQLFRDIRSAVSGDGDVLLIGEKGIDKVSIAEAIHGSGSNNARRSVYLDLASFGDRSSEGLFWSTMQGLLQDRMGTPNEEQTGTVILDGIGMVSDHFILSVLGFLNKRKSDANIERTDKSIRIVLIVEDGMFLADFHSKNLLADFAAIHIPPLRDRKEDLPMILDAYLSALSRRFDKDIAGISTDLLKFFSVHDWPGNYRELALMLKVAVLNSRSGTISTGDVPTDVGMLIDRLSSESAAHGGEPLGRLSDSFDRLIYPLAVRLFPGNAEKAADFLDIPRAAFSQKARSLGLIG
jgi:DNA-binding NtrC family response regulator